jgi:hypothetical protein
LMTEFRIAGVKPSVCINVTLQSMESIKQILTNILCDLLTTLSKFRFHTLWVVKGYIRT